MDVVVSIGPKFAHLLGYQEVVGSMGVISRTMDALIEIQVLEGPAMGKVFDVHKEDVMIHQQEDSVYSMVADYNQENVYYTTDFKYAQFVADVMLGWGKSKRLYNACKLPSMIEHYEKFTFHNIDDETDPIGRIFMHQYKKRLAAQNS